MLGTILKHEQNIITATSMGACLQYENAHL